MHRIVVAGVVLAAVAIAGVLGAGLGHRFELWDFRVAFTVLRWSAWTGAAAAVVSLIGTAAVLRVRPVRGLVPAAVGLAAGVAVAAVPYTYLRTARSVPPIHDVSTDTVDPPAFVAVLPLRAGASNPAGYGGPQIAAQQLVAYPDVRPARLALSPSAVFDRALEAADALEWRIVAAAREEGRIEAVATTFWFGFRDDVVIRIRADGDGSRVDVRSVSRVGKGDAGANARRVRALLARLGS